MRHLDKLSLSYPAACWNHLWRTVESSSVTHTHAQG